MYLFFMSFVFITSLGQLEAAAAADEEEDEEEEDDDDDDAD